MEGSIKSLGEFAATFTPGNLLTSLIKELEKSQRSVEGDQDQITRSTLTGNTGTITLRNSYKIASPMELDHLKQMTGKFYRDAGFNVDPKILGGVEYLHASGKIGDYDIRFRMDQGRTIIQVSDTLKIRI
ncbi:hypothetical protein K8R33_02265 [archaeon]|nr:hypothetical protein [archaeon]